MSSPARTTIAGGLLFDGVSPLLAEATIVVEGGNIVSITGPSAAEPGPADADRPDYFDEAEREHHAREWGLPPGDLGSYVRAMWDHATTPNGVLGSKLMFNDFDWLRSSLRPPAGTDAGLSSCGRRSRTLSSSGCGVRTRCGKASRGGAPT